MPRRAATVTQADVARTIRAALQEGLKIARVVTRADGVSIETVEAVEVGAGDDGVVAPSPQPKPSIVL